LSSEMRSVDIQNKSAKGYGYLAKCALGGRSIFEGVAVTRLVLFFCAFSQAGGVPYGH
jgi:hypothetical protein